MYKPYYPGGWKSGAAGGTPLTPEALDHFDEGIASALPADKVIAVYGAPVNFTAGVGYYENTAIHSGVVVAMAQIRCEAPGSAPGKVLGVNAEDGRLKIVLEQTATVEAMPVNILIILP